MALNVVVTKSLTAASDNCIAANQTLSGAGNFNLNGSAVSGGVATLDTGRRVLLTFAGDETGHNFTIYGTLQSTGAAISEVVAGTTAGTVATVQDFKTVTQATSDSATTGNVKIGTNGVGSSPWNVVNYNISPVNLSFGGVVTGTVNFTVEYTYDNPQNQVQINFPPNVVKVPTAWALSAMTSKAANTDGTINDPIFAWRVTVNSGTGSVTVTGVQAGIRN